MSGAKAKYTPQNNGAAAAVASNDQRDISQNDDNACVVCFKNVEIYSIGDCDHPVCYECSTRMRVLCQQNECPICRHVLSKVLFTHEKLPYRELEAKNRSEFYSKRYRIGFYNAAIQQKFFELLNHPCSQCNTQPYRTFEGLRKHVRSQHDMYYCDICTEHLKIFTFERRCYTYNELNLHLTKGDPDNTSHRGHPLCEYCNKRFLDRDELFRHLRREHYFCHFCDADGFNEFYKDYDELANHFRRDHFLCEEGKCATEQFVGAFRTEIDYKAHVANVHGKSLNKQQAKQTRTLQLEITLGPRGRSGQNEQGIANLRSRNNESHHEYPDEPSYSGNHRQVAIDAGNEEEFPSLAGVVPGPNVSLVRPPPPSIRNRTGTAGLARTKENFPALGGNAASSPQRASNYSTPVAAMLKKQNAAVGAVPRTSTASAPSNGMVIHVSNRPTSSQSNNTNKKSNAIDFPSLPMGGKGKKNLRNLDEDMPSSSGISMTGVAAKHRTLVEDYVSVAHPSTFQKIQMVQKEELEAKARREAEKRNAPKLGLIDFPSLGNPPSVASSVGHGGGSTWIKAVNEKKQREAEARKSKVAPAPILPTSKINNSNVQEQKIKKNKKSKDNKTNQENTPAIHSFTTDVPTTKQKEKNNSSNEQKLPKKSQSSNSLNENVNPKTPLRVPPGFDGTTVVNPPPGFISNVTVNSVAKLPNDLTFTTSLGQSYNIVPSSSSYTQPPDTASRNQKLVNEFCEVLKTPEALEEFRLFSQKFREGAYKPQAYYDHCKAALQNKFNKVFPELLALLPDISKQQELYLAHKQHINTLSSDQRKTLAQLEVCDRCKQVLIARDLRDHKKMHDLKSNFPALGTSSKAPNAQRK